MKFLCLALHKCSRIKQLYYSKRRGIEKFREENDVQIKNIPLFVGGAEIRDTNRLQDVGQIAYPISSVTLANQPLH